ncbi:MAG TPA: hypothetical protein VN625_10350 [Desulfuromonadaceae bacterium]|nr:hypothetical protein [Desulfuromonadaceae bacterium]
MQSPDQGEHSNAAKTPSASSNKTIRRLLYLFICLLVLVIGYIGAAFAVFDFSKPAFPFSQKNGGDSRPVAFGPRPREQFCPPNWGGVYWKGNEWPFIVFAPICHWWCAQHGYATVHAEK